MAIYSDVLERLQLTGDGRMLLSDLISKLGYTRYQILASVAQYHTNHGVRLYYVGMDDIVRSTDVGMKFDIRNANITRSDAGVARGCGYTRVTNKMPLPLIELYDVISEVILIMMYANNGEEILSNICKPINRKITEAIQSINVFNMKVRSDLIRLYADKKGVYRIEISAESSTYITQWNQENNLDIL